jgi:hypothetical protein
MLIQYVDVRGAGVVRLDGAHAKAGGTFVHASSSAADR